MDTSLSSISDIVTKKIPLKVLLAQCDIRNKYNPLTQFAGWVHCLNEVNEGQSYQYTAQDFATAIPEVWSAPSLMNRDTMTKGLKGIKNSTGGAAFAIAAVYQAVNSQFPITVTVEVDTDGLLAAHGNNLGDTFNANNWLTITDDNNDPSQGSFEMTIYCNVGNTIRWVAAAHNGTDTVELTAFIDGGGTDVFGGHPPTHQTDGSFQGTTSGSGHETYHYNFTVNGGNTTYWWDPFIQCNP